MWRFFLLLAIGLANASLINRQRKAFSRLKGSLSNPVHHEETKSPKLDAEYDKLSSEFLRQISAAHAKQPKRRSKRESGSLKTSLLIDDTGAYRLREIVPLFPLCPNPLDVTFVDVGNDTHAVCLSAATSFSPGEVTIGRVSTEWYPLAKSFTSDAKEATAFQTGEYLYILVADSDRGDGTDLFKYSMVTGQLVIDHTINSRYATALSVWKMKTDGRYHLAIANSHGKERADDLRSEVYVYNWMGTYFDRYQSFSSYDVKDIETFHIHSTAYLAIASHRKDQQNYNVDSEILKFDQDRQKWRSHQKIRTYGAMDWEFFSFGEGPGEEFFLAVANYAEYTDSQVKRDVNSVIYKFVGDKFVPFQCLLTSGAVSISALKGRSEFLLAVANADDAVRIYQYDGWQFVSASIQFTQNSMSSGVNSLAFHEVKNPLQNKLVLAVSNSKRSDTALYEMVFDTENSLRDWHEQSTMWCMNALDETNSPKNLDTLDEMRNVFYVDQDEPITITGNLHFDGGLEVSKLSTSKLKDLNHDQVYDHNILFKLNELHNRLRQIKEKLSEVEKRLRGALFKSGNQTVTGNYNFEEATFMCVDKECQFEDVKATFLNGIDISNLVNAVVFLDQDQVINDTLYVESIEAPSIAVDGLVDGVEISDLVTRSGTHTITGMKTFIEEIRAKDVEVSGLVDGVSISPKTVLLNNVDQQITGNIVFTDVATKWLKINGNLNGIPLDQFYEDLVFIDKSCTITGRKSFSNVVISGEFLMSPGSLIDSVDLEDLWNNVMWKHGYQDITAPINFTSLTLLGSVHAGSTINGIMIPGPEILLLSNNATITAPQTFEKDTSISELKVEFINGIGLVHDPQSELQTQLDILLKSYKQTITGHKTFHTIHLDFDSYVGRFVDGIDLSELKDTALHRTTSFTSNGTWTFNNVVVEGPLHVKGLVSSINLDDIYDKALKLTDTALTDFDSFIFKNVVHISDLETEFINGLDISRDLVFVDQPQTISGVKIFESVILDSDSEVLGLVNNVDLSFLNDTLLTIGDQTITSDKTFEGDLIVRTMTVHGRLNGVPFDEIVLVNRDQTITGTKEFFDLTVKGHLNVDNLEVDGFVNNIDIATMIDDTMTYEGIQVVKGKKIIKGTLTISENSNLQTNSLNGVHLSSLYADAVLVDVPQMISGRKTFNDTVAFDKVWSRGSIDGVTEWEMKHNWMTEGTNQEVDGNVIFENGLTVTDINVNGYINGVNVTELNATIVKTTESAVINGPILFKNRVISKGDVTLTGNIQGIDLSEEAVLRSDTNIIYGRKEFVNDILIAGNLHVGGLIDEISVEELCRKSIYVNQDQNISRMVIDGDVTFYSEVTTDGLFGGIDVVTFNRTAVKINEDSFINGIKTFDKLIIEGPLIVHGTVGGVDIAKLNESYMSVTREQVISSELEFDVLEIKGSMSAKNLFTTNDRINNIDVKELERTVLRTTGLQMANTTYNFENVIFEDDMVVIGKIDGLKIPGDVMLHNKTNYIQSPKVFAQNLRVLTDLVIADGFTIQGVDLSDLAHKTVYKDVGEFDITGWKTFHDLELNDVRVTGLIDNMEISENSLLLTYGDQTITGRKIIHNDVKVENDLTVNGLVNGVDLKDFSARVVRRDRSNVITGNKYFEAPLTIGTLEVTGLIDGVDIHQLEQKANTKVDLKPLEKRLYELDDIINEMQSAFEKQAVILQYYELFQDFVVPGAYTWSYVPLPGGKDVILLSSIAPDEDGCTKIQIHEYDETEKKLKFRNQEILSSSAVAIKSILAWGSTLVFVANQLQASQCRQENPRQTSLGMGSGNCPSAVYIWDSVNSTFQAYQTLMMNPATDLVVFSDGSMVCAVYTELNSVERKYNAATKVYCAHDIERDFVLYETLHTKGAKKATILQNANKTILAVVGTTNDPDSSSRWSVLIYNWDSTLRRFGSPVQAIQTISAQSVLLMHYEDGYSSKTLLIVAESRVREVSYNPPLSVYKYEAGRPEPFVHSQKIFEYGVIDLAWIVPPSGDLIFFALTEDGTIKVYKYQEASGFVRLDTLNTGAATIIAFTRKDLKDSMNHYLALAGSSRRLMRDEPDTARILKSKMKGRRLPYYR